MEGYSYRFEPPFRWEAGAIGGRTIYFDCGACGAKEPELHAGVFSRPVENTPYGARVQFADVMIFSRDPNSPFKGLGAPALFCKACAEKYFKEKEASHEQATP